MPLCYCSYVSCITGMPLCYCSYVSCITGVPYSFTCFDNCCCLCVVMTSGGLLVNQSLMSLVASPYGYVTNVPQSMSLAVGVLHLWVWYLSNIYVCIGVGVFVSLLKLYGVVINYQSCVTQYCSVRQSLPLTTLDTLVVSLLLITSHVSHTTAVFVSLCHSLRWTPWLCLCY